MAQEDAHRLATEAAEAAKALICQLLSMDERSAIIVGAARLDAALERLLRSRMLDPVGKDDALFGGDGPLGTLRAKVALAHRLGLISSDVERAMHLLRRIRNEFAHSFEDESLSIQCHADRLSAACSEVSKTAFWASVQPTYETVDFVPTALLDYVVLVTVLVCLVESFSKLEQRPGSVPLIRFELL